jgi:hypothetical protein
MSAKKRKVTGNILRDDEITLKTKKSKGHYPKRMRRIVALVEVDGKSIQMVFITVIDGRSAIVEEINRSPKVLRNNLIRSIQLLNANEDFQEALPGHLPPDTASQLRLPQLKQKLKDIAALSII